VPVSWSELRALDSAHPWGVRDLDRLVEHANGRALQGWGVADQVLPDL
jgi:bifunctional non-homologous end joining protein LigD